MSLCFSHLGSGKRITGEVYEVSMEQLGDVDLLEGHPKVYTRMPIDVELVTNGKEMTAECYFMINHNPALEQGVTIDNYDHTTGPPYIPRSQRYPGHDEVYINRMMESQWKNPNCFKTDQG